MSRLRLSRRTFLRAAAGISAAIALPPLEAMFDGNGERLAHAGNGTPPKRLITFYMGNGVPTIGYCAPNNCTERWLPPTQGANFTLSEAMQPLSSVKQYVRVMSGLRNPYPGTSHCQNMGGVMTGKPIAEGPAESHLAGATPDFLAGKTLSAGARFKQLSLLVAGASYAAISRNTLTFDDAGQPVRPTRKPQDLFNQLFSGFVAPGAMTAPDPRLVLRRSILDFVRDDTTRLRAQLGAADRQRLDQHLTSIEAIQQSLNVTATATATCAVPGAPPASPDYQTMTRQMSDLIVLALACDQTRAIAFGPTGCNCDVVLPWIYPTDYHSESHDACCGGMPDVMVHMTKYTQWHLTELAYLTQRLAAVKEGAGSLLDSTLLVTTSEHGSSNYHDAAELPHIVVGGPALVTGNYHWRASSAPTPSFGDPNAGFISNSRLWLSVLQALGTGATSFGTGETATVPLK